MVDSNNIEIIRENIKELDQKVDSLDVEIPAHTSSDSGKYLGVASDGSLAFSKVPDELPDTTSATAGQILSLDSNKDLEWSDNYNLNYSTSETDTCKKWIDGKTIYRKVITGQFGTISETQHVLLEGVLPLGVDIVSINGIAIISDGTNTGLDHFTMNYYPDTGNFRIYGVTITLSQANYNFIVEYTKPAPTPETKKKKSTK